MALRIGLGGGVFPVGHRYFRVARGLGAGMGRMIQVAQGKVNINKMFACAYVCGGWYVVCLGAAAHSAEYALNYSP